MKTKAVLICLIFMVLYHATGADLDIHNVLRQLDEKENDPNTSQSEKKKLDQYRTMMIKKAILKMLGLKSAPNITHTPHIPKHILNTVLKQTDEGVVGDTSPKEIIVMAEQDALPKLAEESRTPLLRFKINLRFDTVSSATLLLRRNPQTLTKNILKKHSLLEVKIRGLSHRPAHLTEYANIIDTNRNWIKLDISSILKSKRRDKVTETISVEVTCKECASQKIFINSKKRRPLIIFKMKHVTSLRKKRSTTCSYGCCLVSYTVNFKDMGYPFIIFPESFPLNYCKGPCKSRTGPEFFYKRIVLFNSRNTSRPNVNDRCCTVSKLASLSVIWEDDSKKFTHLVVNNIQATECDCT